MNGTRTLWSGVIETLTRGSDDPRIVAISFAAAAVVLAVLVATALLIASWTRATRRKGPGLPGLARRRSAYLGPVVVVSVALLLAISASYLGRSDTCMLCHEPAGVSHRAASHASVACVGCHREPGITGFIVGQADMARRIAATAAAGWRPPEPGQGSATLASRSCLLRCHGEVRSGTSSDGVIVVRHADLLDRPCAECHNTVGHGDQVRLATRPDMRICLSCHDGRQVSAQCATCHVGDVAYAARRATPRTPAIKVAAPTGTNCRGCHETDTCNECHGVEMPHPPDWMPGHARPAFEQPNVCWRCHAGPEYHDTGPHPYAMCNQCHRFPGPHGSSADWRRRHGAAAAKAPDIIGRTRCGLCHTNPRFCDLCHEGRQERVDYR